jgi:hypothetical protein
MDRRNKAKPPRRRWIWLLVPITAYVVFAIWKYWPAPRKVPQELVGTWKTTDSSYADRTLEIGLVTINFGTGEGKVNTGFIQRVETEPIDERHKLYTIFYVLDGVESQCSFYYERGRDVTIYFKNQPHTRWIKDKEG